MKSHTTILEENKNYWTWRAPGYSEVNKQELSSEQKERWKNCLHREIQRHFANRPRNEIHILDVGTGPGFFAILLTELGYSVTAVDLTHAMIEEARANAGPLSEKIRFLEMNAEELLFEDEKFDVIVTRNLTWNLPRPQKAYSQWVRVLKHNGLLINFDANWYAYLFDEKALKAYEQDRTNSKEAGISDFNIGEHFDVMEEIARHVPLSNIQRPQWDMQVLFELGVETESNTEIWREVWSDQEILNLSSTPMFMITGIKNTAAPGK